MRKDKYEVTAAIKKEIIDYCESLILLINVDFFRLNQILENEFLVCLYATCEALYKKTGTFKLSTKEIILLLTAKKDNDIMIEEISANAILTGIDKNDKLTFELKNKLKITNG